MWANLILYIRQLRIVFFLLLLKLHRLFHIRAHLLVLLALSLDKGVDLDFDLVLGLDLAPETLDLDLDLDVDYFLLLLFLLLLLPILVRFKYFIFLHLLIVIAGFLFSPRRLPPPLFHPPPPPSPSPCSSSWRVIWLIWLLSIGPAANPSTPDGALMTWSVSLRNNIILHSSRLAMRHNVTPHEQTHTSRG